MILRRGLTCAALVAAGMLAAGCTGGTEGKAAEEKAPQKNPIVTASAPAEAPAQPEIDAKQELKSINHAIPIYAGAKFRDDLTRRDAVMIRNQYGPQASVHPLA